MQLSGRPASWLAWGSSLSLIGVIWAIALANLQSERREAVEAAVRENQNRAIGLGEYVRRTLEAANLAAQYLGERVLADRPDAGKGDRPRLLTGRIARNPLFSSIQITNADGDVRYTSVTDAPASNIGAREVFKAAQEAGDAPIISRPAMSPNLYRPTFSLTRAIRDADGRFAGVVIIQMPVERLTAFNQGARIRPLDLISVIRQDGITLARRTGTQISYGEDLRGALVMRQQNRSPNGTYLGPSALDGKMRYFSHRRLREFPLFVTVGVGEADVLAPVERRARWYFAAAALLSAALLAVALLITLGANRRARAASALEEANQSYERAQRIGRIGDWTYDPVTRSITCSGPLCEMYERSPAENRLSLDQALSYYDAPSRDALARAIDTALATGEPQQCECVVQLGSGRQTLRRLVFSRVADEDGG
jgi:PAS domain-containing protein